MLSTDFAPNFI